MQKMRFILLLTILTFQSLAQSKNFIDQPYLETTATVDTLVTPDRVYLSILITEKDTRGKISVEELENRMNTKLLALGIDSKEQLSLSDVTSNFQNYFLKGKDVLKNKAYTLLVYDAKTAGIVIAELESLEISNVYLIKTEYSKAEELKIILKQKAITKAKTAAEAMLKPLNQYLGKAIFISDFNSYLPNTLQGKVSGIRIRGYSSTQEAQYDAIDIEFDKISFESTVTVNFEIK